MTKLVPAGPLGAHLDLQVLHDRVATRLKTSYVNFALSTQFNNGSLIEDTGGYARRELDPPVKPMSTLLKMCCASNSKLITAVAVLRCLWESSSASLDSPIFPYLPAHWTVNPDVKKLTFKDLLGFRTGFPTKTPTDYASMKQAVSQRLFRRTRLYKNVDFALFRIILPILAGKTTTIQITSSTPSNQLSNIEEIHNAEYSIHYKQLVHKYIFDKMAMSAELKSTDTNEMLRYRWPDSNSKGKRSTDHSNSAGSTGWYLSCRDFNRFCSYLLCTEVLLPKWIREKMRDDLLAFDSVGESAGIKYLTKGGRSHGPTFIAYWSRLVGFENGVCMTIYANNMLITDQASAEKIAKEEFADWYQPPRRRINPDGLKRNSLSRS